MPYIQSKSTSTDGTASTTVAITMTSNVTVGNKIVGYWYCDAGGIDDLIQIKDALGNANATISDTVLAGDIQKMFWYDITVGGAATITATTTASHGFRGIVAHEVSSLLSGAPDKHVLIERITPGTGTDAITTGNVTTTTDGQYIFGAVHVNNTVVMTVTQGTGYTDRESIDGTASISPVESEDQIQTSAGAIAVTFTQSSNQTCVPGIMTFVAAAIVVENTLMGQICL